MVLQPWASNNGVLYQDCKPVPGASIVARPIRQLGGDNPHLQDSFWTLTDVGGSILTSWEDYLITSNQVIPLDLRPGESRSVPLGGDGLRVTGSVRLIGDRADAIEFRYGIHQLAGSIGQPENRRRFQGQVCGPGFDLARLNGEWSQQGIEVVGISVDADIEAAQAFVDENKFPWTQGFAGELTETAAGRLLGIGSVPTYILLDPEGKIVARSSSLDEIEQVAGALE